MRSRRLGSPCRVGLLAGSRLDPLCQTGRSPVTLTALRGSHRRHHRSRPRGSYCLIACSGRRDAWARVMLKDKTASKPDEETVARTESRSGVLGPWARPPGAGRSPGADHAHSEGHWHHHRSGGHASHPTDRADPARARRSDLLEHVAAEVALSAFLLRQALYLIACFGGCPEPLRHEEECRAGPWGQLAPALRNSCSLLANTSPLSHRSPVRIQPLSPPRDRRAPPQRPRGGSRPATIDRAARQRRPSRAARPRSGSHTSA